jgi:tRNA threonylcarbamoyladenosine biosynthesis protein TsaB
MMTMALETSTPRGGVALFRNGEMIFSHTFTADRSHSSELFAVIERALAPDLRPGRIAVGLGPGSYAGVRIAIAAAIGLSVATGAELIGLPSVAALAEGEYLALGDARRGAYAFSHVRDGEIIEGPMLQTREEIDARLGRLPAYSSEELGLTGVEIRFPCVERLGRLAAAGRAIAARGALEPIYLREPHITTSRKNPPAGG